MKDEKSNDRLRALKLPEGGPEEAEVFSLRNLGTGWELSRREVATAATIAAGGAAMMESGAQSGICGGAAAHSANVVAIAASGNGALLCSVGSENILKIWKLPEGAYRQSIALSAAAVSLAVAWNASIAAVGLASGGIRLVNLANGASTVSTPHRQSVRAVAFSRDGRFLASASGDPGVLLSKLIQGSLADTVATLPGDIPTALAFTHDSEFLIVGYASGLIRILTVPEFIPLAVAPRHTQQINSLAVSADGAYLVSCSSDRSAKIWSLPAGDLLRSIDHPNSVTGVGLEGEFLVTSCVDGFVRTWTLPGGANLRSISAGAAIPGLAVGPSADGGRVVTAAANTMQLWALSDGRAVISCMIDLAASAGSTQGTSYSVGNVTYVLPCGSPIPAGAVCICNCVAASPPSTPPPAGCPTNCPSNCPTNSTHYWYPN